VPTDLSRIESGKSSSVRRFAVVVLFVLSSPREECHVEFAVV